MGKKSLIKNNFMHKPVYNELVIGTIVGKLGNNFLLDIGSTSLANLRTNHSTSFSKNVTKLKIGDNIYARVISTHPNMETQLSCIESSEKVIGLGRLQAGFALKCSCHLAKKILNHS